MPDCGCPMMRAPASQSGHGGQGGASPAGTSPAWLDAGRNIAPKLLHPQLQKLHGFNRAIPQNWLLDDLVWPDCADRVMRLLGRTIWCGRLGAQEA